MATFVEGRFYSLQFADGETAFILVREPMKNGSNRTLSIDTMHRRARQDSTTNLTPARWTEITDAGVPPKLLAKINARVVLAPVEG